MSGSPQQKSLKVLLWVIAPLTAAVGIWLLVAGHQTPGVAVLVAGAGLIASLAFATRETADRSANPQQVRTFSRLGVLIGIGVTLVGVVLAVVSPGFMSQMLLMAGIGGTLGYMVITLSSRRPSDAGPPRA